MQLLAGLGPFGLPELAIILVIVILIFGMGRLPEVGGAVGKGIREFRKATKDDENAAAMTPTTMSSTSTPAGMGQAPSSTMTAGMPTNTGAPMADMPAANADAFAPISATPMPNPSGAINSMFCGECGARNPRTSKFCAECGHTIGTPVS